MGFYLPRRNLFQGRWVRHGGLYPDWQLRLFRRGRGAFVERAVHESVRVDGPTGRFSAAAGPRELPEHRRRRRAAEPVLRPRCDGAGRGRAGRQPGGPAGPPDLAIRVDVSPAGRIPRRVAGPRAGGRSTRTTSSCAPPRSASAGGGGGRRDAAVAVIPARWASVRFPGKALVVIRGKPLVQHVWERASRARDGRAGGRRDGRRADRRGRARLRRRGRHDGTRVRRTAPTASPRRRATGPWTWS